MRPRFTSLENWINVLMVVSGQEEDPGMFFSEYDVISLSVIVGSLYLLLLLNLT